MLPKSSIDAPLDHLEQVLVAGTPDDLSMSLILDDSLLSPDTQWNLDRFCVATEGVSHVLYLASTAQRGRVSAFELELQAEIDKFLVLVTAVNGVSSGTTTPLCSGSISEHYRQPGVRALSPRTPNGLGLLRRMSASLPKRI